MSSSADLRGTPEDPVVLHGRDAPMQALRAALASAAAGRGQIAIISGDAGIGKTAIAAAIAREAEAQKAIVTWGRAWEFADAPPYFPVWPCLRSLGIAVGPANESKDDGSSHAFHLWEDVVSALARTSSTESPLVWILEDLHAADLGTLDLLTFLTQPLRAMHVLVVATVRAKDPRLTDRMMQRLTRMTRDGLDVRLEALTDRDIAALTEEILGKALPEGALPRLRDLTGGNPLFIVECARAFRSAGGVEGTLKSLPSTVRQVVLERMALLSESTRDALASGAVLGREFSAASVARMAGPRASLPARVIDTLLPALRSGLIEETRPGHFIFSHVLVRDAIDDSLGGEQRATLHARADVALEALGDSSDVLLERARHALLALPRRESFGETEEKRTLAIADRATELLEREGAFDRAFDLHVRIDDARRSGLLPPTSPTQKLHFARIARAAGRSDVSRRLCDEVIASAREAKDAELLARAALLSGANIQIGIVDRAQVALLEEAKAALGALEQKNEHEPELVGLACRVLARLATAMVPWDDPAVPMGIAYEALRRARATKDDAVILDVLDMAGWALVDLPPAEERIGLSTELLERALRANDLPKAMTGYVRLAFDHIEGGDFRAFDRDMERMLSVSDELGHPRHRWQALLLASTRATTLGHFAESDRYVMEVTQLQALTDDPSITLALTNHDLMRGNVQRRDVEEQRAAFARLEAVLSGVWEAAFVTAVLRAVCEARMENVEETRAALAAVDPNSSAAIDEDRTFVAFLGEAHALAGDADFSRAQDLRSAQSAHEGDRRRHFREVLSRAKTRDVSGGHVPFTYEGTVPRVIGLLDASLGDLELAEQHLREAYSLAVERRHAPWVAQIAYELAKVIARRDPKRNDEAKTLFDESLTIAKDLGMPGLEKSIARATISSSPTSTSPSTSTDKPAPASMGAAPPTITLAKEGELWSIVKGGAVVARVRDTRGIQLLARLVERPGQEVHVLTLASDEGGASIAETSAGEVLDERARKAYRQRLSDLEEDIAEAEERADIERASKLELERDALRTELARAAGLGGRTRQAGSATERARVNVQRRVKDAIARITEADKGLGRFFERAVCTGTFCCFRP